MNRQGEPYHYDRLKAQEKYEVAYSFFVQFGLVEDLGHGVFCEMEIAPAPAPTPPPPAHWQEV